MTEVVRSCKKYGNDNVICAQPGQEDLWMVNDIKVNAKMQQIRMYIIIYSVRKINENEF